MMVSKATPAPIPLTHSDLRHILNAPAAGLAHLLGTLPPGTTHLLQDLTQRLPREAALTQHHSQSPYSVLFFHPPIVLHTF